ncbi:MAG: two-component sensor histidine kinase [Rhodobacteraceae bacterium]|nr:two-component sensor histidine kinase [Paracoccaceae bacterium]
MLEGLTEMIRGEAFMPHGMCLLWRPDLLFLHGGSDLFIALAYLTIPLVIMRAARLRPDLIDAKVARLFAVFITACALSHLAGLATLWWPAYGIQGLIKAATAVVSVYTAVELARLLPSVLTMPSRADLAARDTALNLQRIDSERVREANEKLNEFAYVASHDLRAPMRGIANHARFLEEDHGPDLPQDARRRLSRMQELCVQMEQLISTLLQYSRISRSEACEDVALEPLFLGIRDRLAETLAERNAEIVLDTPLPVMAGDPAGFETVLTNLISNGLTYNSSAAPRVHVGFLDQVEVDGAVLEKALYVRDNGIGIAPDQHDLVFRMFKRLHPPEAYGPGTGAGLAFVRRVVESQGGTVCLHSAPDEGSTFYLTFPGPNAAPNHADRPVDTAGGYAGPLPQGA